MITVDEFKTKHYCYEHLKEEHNHTLLKAIHQRGGWALICHIGRNCEVVHIISYSHFFLVFVLTFNFDDLVLSFFELFLQLLLILLLDFGAGTAPLRTVFRLFRVWATTVIMKGLLILAVVIAWALLTPLILKCLNILFNFDWVTFFFEKFHNVASYLCPSWITHRFTNFFNQALLNASLSENSPLKEIKSIKVLDCLPWHLHKKACGNVGLSKEENNDVNSDPVVQ